MAYRKLSQRATSKRPKHPAELESAMSEVHRNIPSTVRRAKHFGPKGKEGMLRAIAFSKARKRSHRG